MMSQIGREEREASYIGPERRKGERRNPNWRFALSAENRERTEGKYDRRVADRRQEALAGVIVGLSAEDMEVLAALWRASEEGRVVVGRPASRY